MNDPDERKVRRLQNRHTRQDEDSWKNGISHTVTSFEGRRFLWLFLAEMGAFHNPFSPDPYTTAYASGRQSAGQRLLEKLIAVSPETYVKMMEENQDVRTNRSQQYRALSGDDHDSGDGATFDSGE